MGKPAILLVLALLLTGCVTGHMIPTFGTGDVERGAQLFVRSTDAAPPCSTCHRVINGQSGFSIGPNLAGITERAGSRSAEMTAEEYLRQSILEPSRYIVSGYRGIMYPNYSMHLTEQNIQDLIAYLLTL